MLPEGYVIEPATPQSKNRWYLRSGETIIDINNAGRGPRYVASGPPGTPRHEMEELAWMDHKMRIGGEDTPEARAALARRFPAPIIPADPILDEKGRKLREPQR